VSSPGWVRTYLSVRVSARAAHTMRGRGTHIFIVPKGHRSSDLAKTPHEGHAAVASAVMGKGQRVLVDEKVAATAQIVCHLLYLSEHCSEPKIFC